MAKGRALAQRGELQRVARARLAQRPTSLERERQLSESGARVGSARAAAFQRRRKNRAVELGFPDLATYYANRYFEQWRRVDEIAAELDCAVSSVRGDLRRLGLGPDRTRSYGARWDPARSIDDKPGASTA